MTIIYEPRGKAREYSPLAANLYKGCSHNCVYCYAPNATFKQRSVFHSANFIAPRKNVLRQFEKDCLKYAEDKREVLFSFTSDAYQPIESELLLTRQTLMIAKKHNIFAVILTKNGILSRRDLPLLASFNRRKFGVTLTHDRPEVSIKWESGAALPIERIAALQDAWTLGIETFVSFEPVIDPEAVYRLIDITHEFVDFYKVGKLNYHPFQKSINWPLFRENVIKQLEYYGKPYMIKKDLLTA
jgi:DNA repair photolyase